MADKDIGDNPTLVEIAQTLTAEQAQVLGEKIRQAAVMATLDPRQKAVFDYVLKRAETTGRQSIPTDLRWNDPGWQ